MLPILSPPQSPTTASQRAMTGSGPSSVPGGISFEKLVSLPMVQAMNAHANDAGEGSAAAENLEPENPLAGLMAADAAFVAGVPCEATTARVSGGVATSAKHGGAEEIEDGETSGLPRRTKRPRSDDAGSFREEISRVMLGGPTQPVPQSELRARSTGPLSSDVLRSHSRLTSGWPGNDAHTTAEVVDVELDPRTRRATRGLARMGCGPTVDAAPLPPPEGDGKADRSVARSVSEGANGGETAAIKHGTQDTNTGASPGPTMVEAGSAPDLRAGSSNLPLPGSVQERSGPAAEPSKKQMHIAVSASEAGNDRHLHRRAPTLAHAIPRFPAETPPSVHPSGNVESATGGADSSIKKTNGDPAAPIRHEHHALNVAAIRHLPAMQAARTEAVLDAIANVCARSASAPRETGSFFRVEGASPEFLARSGQSGRSAVASGFLPAEIWRIGAEAPAPDMGQAAPPSGEPAILNRDRFVREVSDSIQPDGERPAASDQKSDAMLRARANDGLSNGASPAIGVGDPATDAPSAEKGEAQHAPILARGLHRGPPLAPHGPAQPAITGAAGGNSYEIALSPRELGHVRLTLHHFEHGVSVLISADRPETLDLIWRHLPELDRDLRAVGHGSVQFSFDGNQGFADDPRGPPVPAIFGDADSQPVSSAPDAVARRPAAPGRGALDIRL